VPYGIPKIVAKEIKNARNERSERGKPYINLAVILAVLGHFYPGLFLEQML
jgi:hypothetical protein